MLILHFVSRHNAKLIVAQASAKVKSFKQLYKEMESAINVSGKSKSTPTNYGRQLAHLALHYNCMPIELDLRAGA